jgi:hypothetical protein
MHLVSLVLNFYRYPVRGDTLTWNTDRLVGLVSGFQVWKCPATLSQTWYQAQMTQIYSNPLKVFELSCPEYPCPDLLVVLHVRLPLLPSVRKAFRVFIDGTRGLKKFQMFYV